MSVVLPEPVLPTMAVHYTASLMFMAWSLRRGSTDQKVLGACITIPLLTALYDAGVYIGWVRNDAFIGSFASPVMLLGMGFVLAHRFATTMKRVEGFNLELLREVTAATGELANTLNRQHALELAHSRAGERLQLVRDLHDGFGGTLVGAIARLQQAPDDTPKAAVIDVLKEMRDDLRLVIDTTAQEQAAAALRASEIGADIILKATKVDGIYDRDPNLHADAKRYEQISFNEALTKRLQVMDSTAFSLCMDNKIPILVFDMHEPTNVRDAVLGKKIGTLVID